MFSLMRMGGEHFNRKKRINEKEKRRPTDDGAGESQIYECV